MRPEQSKLSALLLACALVSAWSGEIVQPATDVGFFPSKGGAPPAPWRVVQLNAKVPPTQYHLAVVDGVAAVQAQADASMALLGRPLAIDIQATPVLCWRWRVQGVVEAADMSRKDGDDYAARVYVAFRMPPDALGFATRAKLGLARALFGNDVPDAAVNYVWDNRHPVGMRRFNAYTDRAAMVVQRSTNQQAGRWVHERANVLDDVVRAFGTTEVTAQLLAVASDTDNTGASASAAFADLHFVGAQAACRFPEPTKGGGAEVNP